MAATYPTYHALRQQRIAPEKDPISIARLRKSLGISRERMARLLDVSAKTVQRWEERDQLPANKWILQIVVELQNITDLGLMSFKPEGFMHIMQRPQPIFGSKSGLQLVEEGRGDEVFGEFAGADEGYLGR